MRAAIAKADTREGSPQNRIIVAFSVGKWANRYAHDLEALNARRSNKLSFRDALSLAKARAGMKRGWHRAMEVAGLMETVAHVERAQDLPVWRAAKAVLEGAWWLVDFTNGRPCSLPTPGGPPPACSSAEAGCILCRGCPRKGRPRAAFDGGTCRICEARVSDPDPAHFCRHRWPAVLSALGLPPFRPERGDSAAAVAESILTVARKGQRVRKHVKSTSPHVSPRHPFD